MTEPATQPQDGAQATAAPETVPPDATSTVMDDDLLEALKADSAGAPKS